MRKHEGYMKYLYAAIIMAALITLLGSITPDVSADEKTAATSANISTVRTVEKEDPRIQKLEKYLESKNSPLAPYAGVFVTEADKHNLDWKFVAAVSGVESGYGKRIPAQSYNGWGWGVYGDNVHRFASWEDGIQTISHDIRVKYMNKRGATDIYSIGRIYAASPTWAQKVTYMMNQIENFEEKRELATLPISI